MPKDWKKIKEEHLELSLEEIFKNPHTFLYINL